MASTREQIPWQEARAWVARTGVLPATHPALQPAATLPEFACLLHDGEVLLRILKRFRPDLSLRIHASPKQPVRRRAVPLAARRLLEANRSRACSRW
jgi:hypothetical protein